MEKDFRDKLTFKPHVEDNKDIIKVWTEWDSNDGDYIEKTFTLSPKRFFSCEKLLYCLAYITCNENFKDGFGVNDSRFCKYIHENCDIDDLSDILDDFEFVVYCDWGMCHTCEGLEITYYDENGVAFDVTFDKIYEEFEKMSYEEICDKINDMEYDYEDDDDWYEGEEEYNEDEDEDEDEDDDLSQWPSDDYFEK